MPEEVRDGVRLTNLDAGLFPGADATKRDLIDYLDAVSGPLTGLLADRPLSVIRVLRGQDPFMQKNLPKYTPDFVPTVQIWAEASRREVTYALCNDRRTLLWFANQRAVEYHPTLVRVGHFDEPDYVILDIDPPGGQEGGGQEGGSQEGGSRRAFGQAVQAAGLVREALGSAGLAGGVKTSGSKGVHVVVPLAAGQSAADAAAATRAIAARAERLAPEVATTAFLREERGGKVFLDATRAGGATVAAAYSPRVRPGTPVSFPVPWPDLDAVMPQDFTIRNAAGQLAGRDVWAELLPPPQRLPAGLVEEGHAIPVARVAAMHEGKRRARARRDGSGLAGRDQHGADR